jgi:Ca2+-binding RTX toxin-like protein
VLAALLLLAPLLSCSCGESATTAEEETRRSGATLGAEVTSCSQAGASGFDGTSAGLTLVMGSVTSLVFGSVNGYLTVNGYGCVKPTALGGAALRPADVKRLVIQSSAGTDRVVLDPQTATGLAVLSTLGAIAIELAAGGNVSGDTISVSGFAGVNQWTAGSAGSSVYIELNGDRIADLKLVNMPFITLSLGAGNDIFSGRGGDFQATHLSTSALTSLPAVTQGLTVIAGDGDDVITGGNGNDTINGGNGNDTFKAASSAVPDGNDTFNGGAGVDTADYSARSSDLVVVMTGTPGGAAGEQDAIGADVEAFTAGSGDDTVTGNALSNHIRGGAGDDTLSGGVNSGSCSTDLDTLDGEAGDDTFDQGANPDCADILNGGAGVDRADYRARGANLSLSLDSTANDGDPAVDEKDNIRTDIEIVLGGMGDDTLTGSANADELHGGPGNDVLDGAAGNDTLSGDSGNDTLNGGPGDDVFDESGADAEYVYMSVERKGDGNDVLNGGTHDTLGLDTARYAARAAAVSVSLCMDARQLTGGPSAGLGGECTDHDGESGEQDQIVNVTHVIGTAFGDTLKGGSADDTLEGLAGDDTLFGGPGRDTLFGDAGDDTLFGDADDDYLDGGSAGMSGDRLDGDSASTSSDGDICVTKASDSVTRCEL